jgi:hypothetical protein
VLESKLVEKLDGKLQSTVSRLQRLEGANSGAWAQGPPAGPSTSTSAGSSTGKPAHPAFVPKTVEVPGELLEKQGEEPLSERCVRARAEAAVHSLPSALIQAQQAGHEAEAERQVEELRRQDEAERQVEELRRRDAVRCDGCGGRLYGQWPFGGHAWRELWCGPCAITAFP